MPNTHPELSASQHLLPPVPSAAEHLQASDVKLALALIQSVADTGASGYSNQIVIDGELWTISVSKHPNEGQTIS